MSVTKTGSVRIDLFGGTLDIEPISLVLPRSTTINLATSLQAKAKITSIDEDGVRIVSKDYSLDKFYPSIDFCEDNLYYNDHFGSLKFIAQILSYFDISEGLSVELSSDAPSGSGLGGSSTMGVVCFHALGDFLGRDFSVADIIKRVKGIEARILDAGPTGYQDYYPALYGGILALQNRWGEVEVTQLFNAEFKRVIEDNVTLVFSGETRFSGVNNWEVYKAFFDKKEDMREGMKALANLSSKALKAIQEQNFTQFLLCLRQEGEIRLKLFPSIMTKSMLDLQRNLIEDDYDISLKICGAGGGGCFLIINDKTEENFQEDLAKRLKEKSMEKLSFEVAPPLGLT